MSGDPVITARALKKSYDNQLVLDGVDLTIERGCAMGLVGAHGAGKTTLIKALLGLIPLDGGCCTVLGEVSPGLTAAARARLSYVPQTHGEFAWLTGEQMLGYIATFYPFFDLRYARDLAERWHVALRSEICTLSPGERHRLSLVRALSTRPDVLLLDEPAARLGPEVRLSVICELIRERVRRGLTLIISSQRAGDLERLCDRLAVLSMRRIVVMAELEWFRRLVCVGLEGDERSLAEISIPSAVLVRKIVDGRRNVVLERSLVERAFDAVPPQVHRTVEELDLEALVAEWLQ